MEHSNDPTPSQGLLQSGGRVAEQLAGGLTSQPMLIAVLILNVSMILAAAYYLAQQETNRINTANQVTDLLRLCIEQHRQREAIP
jgi:hypothetical protein